MKLWLMSKHLIAQIALWNATCQAHGAEVIALEAEAEWERAAQLLARNLRLLEEARQRAADSGWRIERRGLLTRWGTRP